ncbi:transcriptional regulator domain-containing protein [Sphingopyxis sp. OPL5]|uniref:transcriptional regulator domain-containing protein n=1 Tax=Sphingopyxis sp. OPL5 TaxID=2486273 RepID=UPI00292A5CF1|nr:DUF6499 domain-containing protein [Sphingopyxis sp. OPL5]
MPMPPRPGWRSRAAGDEPEAPGRPEFAAEFLRRNRRYRTEHDAMMRRIESGTVSEEAGLAALARRWGLSFRLCALPACRTAVLAARACRHHDCPRRRARRIPARQAG